MLESVCVIGRASLAALVIALRTIPFTAFVATMVVSFGLPPASAMKAIIATTMVASLKEGGRVVRVMRTCFARSAGQVLIMARMAETVPGNVMMMPTSTYIGVLETSVSWPMEIARAAAPVGVTPMVPNVVSEMLGPVITWATMKSMPPMMSWAGKVRGRTAMARYVVAPGGTALSQEVGSAAATFEAAMPAFKAMASMVTELRAAKVPQSSKMLRSGEVTGTEMPRAEIGVSEVTGARAAMGSEVIAVTPLQGSFNLAPGSISRAGRPTAGVMSAALVLLAAVVGMMPIAMMLVLGVPGFLFVVLLAVLLVVFFVAVFFLRLRFSIAVGGLNLGNLLIGVALNRDGPAGEELA